MKKRVLRCGVSANRNETTMSNPNPQNKWQPGESGNPDGRPPKGYSLVEIMRQKLSEVDKETGKQRRELVINQLLKAAIRKGDLAAIKMAIQYMDGMPLQKTDITTGGKPLGQLPEEAAKELEKAYGQNNTDIEAGG